MSAVEKSVVETTEEYRSIPVDQVSVAVNIRRTFDQGKLEELAASLKEYGVLEPLVVRSLDGKYGRIYELVAGERRLRAARIAGLPEVPCRIVQLDAKQVAEIQLLENLQREDLNPLEEAQALSDLMWEHGYSQEALAKKLGKSQPWVASRTRLLDLPEAVRDGITRGIVSASAAEVMMPYAKAEAVLVEVVKQMEKEQIPVTRVAHEVGWRVRRDCKAVFTRGYYGDAEPKFEVGPCQNCPKVIRMREEHGGEGNKPWCTDVACWEGKQKVAGENAVAKALEEGEAAGVIDLNKLNARQYHEFKWGESTPEDCRGCEHLKKGKSYGTVCDTCMNPKCYNRRKREQDKAKKQAEEDALNSTVSRFLSALQERDVVDSLAFLPRRLLVFLAGLVFLEVEAPYEFEVRKWRETNLGWPTGTSFGDFALGGIEWGKLASALHVLDNTALAMRLLEWVIACRAAGPRQTRLQPLLYLTGEWQDVSKPAPGDEDLVEDAIDDEEPDPEDDDEDDAPEEEDPE